MSAPFVVACTQCGAKLKLKDSSAAGKKLRCPKCQSVFVAAAADASGGAARKPGAKQSPAKPKDEFDLGGISEDDYEPPPSEEGEEQELDELPQSPVARRKAGAKSGGKKKKRASSGPGFSRIALIGALVLLGIGLVGGVGYGVYALVQGMSGAGGADRLAWMPEDAEFVVEIRVADIWAAAALQPLINSEVGKQMQTQMQANAPLEISQIERVVIGSALAAKQPIVVTYAKSPVDQAKVAGTATPSEYGGYQLYSQGTSGSLFFADASTIVLGPEDKLKAAIDRQGVCPVADRFRGLPSGGQIAVLATNLQNAVGERPALLTAPGVALDGVQSLTVGINIGQNIDFNLACECRDSAAAAEMLEKMQQDKTKSLAQLQTQKSQLVANPFVDVTKMQKLLDAAEQTLQSQQMASSGSSVTSEFSAPGSIVQDAVEMMGPMMSMMMQSLPSGGGAPDGFTPPAAIPAPSENPTPVSEHAETP